MKFSVIAFMLVFAMPLSAHPDPRHTLEEIQEHLDETPDDPKLLLQKALLFVAMDEAVKARPIVSRLLNLDPSDRDVLLLDARLALLEGDGSAYSKSRSLTETRPDFPAAWNFLSIVEEGRGERDAAISAMRRSLDLDPEPSPSDVMTCAAWLRERGKNDDLETAVNLLDQGLAKLGLLSGLHYQAIDLELRLGRFDSSLRRIDALAARFRPSPDLSLRRADILEKANRFAEAAAACDSALALLDLLPASRKQAPAFKVRFEEISRRKAANLAR